MEDRPVDTTLGLAAAVSRPKRDGSRRSPKISEVVARQLVDYIVESDLPEGTVLPKESELIDIFGVARTTLREALRLLETRGVLTIRPGPRGGPIVRRPTAGDLGESLTLILQFKHASYADVVAAHRVIEPLVARLAAERRRKADLALLQASVDAIRVESDDAEDRFSFMRENTRFHTLIAATAGNAVLEAFVGSVQNMADEAVVDIQYDPGRRRTVGDAHQLIVDALRARDPDAAETAMRAHLDEGARHWARKHRVVMDSRVMWVN